MKMLWCRMFILSALLFMTGASESDSRTYQHTLPNGDKIQCQKCQQGTYLKSNCMANSQEAMCAPCQIGTFQPDMNVAHSCAACTSCKYPEWEYVFKVCTSIADTVCICKDGYYRENGVSSEDALCVTDKPCPIGYKVNIKGDGTHATTCVPCPVGYFSDKESFSANCTQCQTCHNGEAVPCDSSSDAICIGEVASFGPAEVAGLFIGAVIILLVVALGILWKIGIIQIHCRDNPQKCHSQRIAESFSEEEPCIEQAENVSLNNIGDVDLLHLSHNLVSADWQLFFYELYGNDGNAKQHIDQVTIDYKDMTTETKIHTLLLKWKEMNKIGATRMQLTKALCLRGKNSLAQQYFLQEYQELMGSTQHNNQHLTTGW